MDVAVARGRMTLRMWLHFWLVLSSVTGTYGIILPPDLRRIMSGVNSLDSFIKAFDLENITLGSPTPNPPSLLPGSEDIASGTSSVTKKTSPKFKSSKPVISLNHAMVPSSKGLVTSFVTKKTSPKFKSIAIGRTGVVSFRDDTNPPIVLDDAMCKPYPTVVEVPQPQHHQGIHYPFNIILHRCAGSCNSKPRVQECVANATENISLLAFAIAWNAPSDSKDLWHRGPRIISMVNHTRCNCRCITKPSECNPATQMFAEDNCRCECRARSRPCPAYHRWDRVRCKCVCDPPSYISCPRRFQWSPEECRCMCKTTACRANKKRNQRNCRCYCPRVPLCPHGFRKNRRTCKCETDI